MDGSQALRAVGAVPLSEAGLASAARAVPLRGRDGSIRAYAMVDAEDYAWASCFRWHLNPQGYAVRNMPHPLEPGKQATLGLSRAIMGLGYGSPWMVDHQDHDPLNNQRANLRVVTHQQNQENRHAGGNRGTSSRFRGVTFRKGRRARPWEAYAYTTRDAEGHRSRIALGCHDTEEEAAEAAAAWRREHMPYSTN